MHPTVSRRNLLVLSVSLAVVLVATGVIDISSTARVAPSQLAGAGGTGLVPCSGVLDCNLCTGVTLLQKIINFAIFLAFAIATPLFAYAGFRLMTSGGNPEGRNKAKEVFKSVGIGLIFVLAGYLIVDTIIHVVIINNKSQYFGPGQSWNSVGHCPVRVNMFAKVSDWLGGLFSVQPTVTPAPGPGGGVTCPAGSSNVGPAGCAWNPDSGKTGYAPPVGYACTTGSFDSSTGGCLTCDEDGKCSQTQMTSPAGTAPPLTTVPADCSASNIVTAAAAGGYTLTPAQANTLSCLSVPESGCSNNPGTARMPNGTRTSAGGVWQIVPGSGNDTCHNLNIPICSQAAGVTGNLNCSSHPNSNECRQALSNFVCNAAAAACMVQNRPSFGDWTADPRNSEQKACISQYNM